MISHEHKLIFIRVTKAASMGMAADLFGYGDKADKVGPRKKPGGIESDYNLDTSGYWQCDPNHYPLYVVRQLVTEKLYNSYYKVGFVRNPWDRMYSSYKYERSWFANYMPEVLKENAMLRDFKTWISNVSIAGKHGNQFNFVNGCDFIGRFEKLQEDYDKVRKELGIPTSYLNITNKASSGLGENIISTYRDVYDDETRDIVATRWAKDIEYFNYEFE